MVKTLSRLFTGSTFVMLGLDAARAPGGRVELAGPVLAAVRKRVPLPEDDELLVRANGVTQLVAGGLLAVGQWPRLSALVLAGSLIPTTAAGHAFWTVQDPMIRNQQRTQFLKNLAMVGGLLAIAGNSARR